jgi:hypothetical protein
MFAKLIVSLSLFAAVAVGGSLWSVKQSSDAPVARAADCCSDGGACCYPGSPCCVDDCCAAGAACCNPPSACCAGTAQAQAHDCCAGGECCNPPQDCCFGGTD